jgi:hypothetical protein
MRAFVAAWLLLLVPAAAQVRFFFYMMLLMCWRVCSTTRHPQCRWEWREVENATSTSAAAVAVPLRPIIRGEFHVARY